jgi:hypothetical protein
MGADYGAVYDQRFHVGIVSEVLMHPFPDSFVAPASKALVDAVPPAVALWQQSPGRTASRHPKHSFDEAATVRFPAHVQVRAASQKLKNLRPLVVGQFYRTHAYQFISIVNSA